MNRFLVAALAATFPATAAAATALAAGGLSIAPAILEREATTGSVGEIRVANSSDRAVSITVRARPWIQSRTGAVRTDGKRSLAGVRLSATSFTLAPGQSRSFSATLLRRPRAGSLYGAVEVTGTPQGARPRNGVRVRYRLLSSLRLNPPRAQRRLQVRVGVARAANGGVVLAVRNTGNTVEPLTGSARITGAAGTLRTTVAGQRILPGANVDVRLHRGRLQPGRYAAAVTLSQGGRRLTTVTRRFRVR